MPENGVIAPDAPIVDGVDNVDNKWKEKAGKQEICGSEKKEISTDPERQFLSGFCGYCGKVISAAGFLRFSLHLRLP